MNNFLDKIPVSTKKTIIAVAPLVVIVILFFVVGNFGFSKINSVRAQINKTKSDESILSEKLKVLDTVSQTLSDSSGVAVTALPEGNPSLIVLTQLKILASANGITISNIKTGTEVKTDSNLSSIDISFDATGTRQQVIDYLKGTANLAPLMILNKLKVSESPSGTLANVIITSFWSPLPKSLPAVTDRITDLTGSEKDILTSISTLTQPVFLEIPSGGGGKADPFTP